MSAYGSARPPQVSGPTPGAPQMHTPFFPPGFMPPFAGVPAPPAQLLAQIGGHPIPPQMPGRPPQPPLPRQQSQQQHVPQPPQQQQQQQAHAAAGRPSEQKRPLVLDAPQPPAKKQQKDTSDLKAAISFVPTHLRTKKLPATAKTQEGPSISRVSAYSMGAGALGRQGGGAGASTGGTTSGLARFLGETKMQKGEAAVRGPQKAGPADLDKAFDEFLKEVGAA